MWNKRAFPHGEMKMTNEEIEEPHSVAWHLGTTESKLHANR
jgi:hypothetical protein